MRRLSAIGFLLLACAPATRAQMPADVREALTKQTDNQGTTVLESQGSSTQSTWVRH